MATLIPTLGSARFDTRGELRLAERLKDFLEENTVVWHNLPMGPRGRHPDFVIVHPSKGLLVLEVKDWRMDTIVSATSRRWSSSPDRGSVRTISPFEQARRYMFDVMRVWSRTRTSSIPSITRSRDVRSCRSATASCSRTSPAGSSQTNLHEVFPEDRCVFKDEMTESVDADQLAGTHEALTDAIVAAHYSFWKDRLPEICAGGCDAIVVWMRA